MINEQSSKIDATFTGRLRKSKNELKEMIRWERKTLEFVIIVKDRSFTAHLCTELSY